MSPLLQVALGGAIGASLRYLAVGQALRWLGAGFPWGTLAVNLAGCFLMGLIFGAFGARFAAAPLLMAGILGGFTTYSAFSLDVLTLIERGETPMAAAYVIATVVGTIALCFAGVMLGRGGPV
jgi:CrcB protein